MSKTAKDVLQLYIKVPIDSISTKHEVVYVSTALLAMEEYANLKCSEMVEKISSDLEIAERKLEAIINPSCPELIDRISKK